MFIDFQEVRSNVSMEALVMHFSLELKRENGTYRGHCPKCEEKGGRSLVVTPEKNVFFCHKWGHGGSVIDLAAHLKEVSVKAAAKYLADTFLPQQPDKEKGMKAQGVPMGPTPPKKVNGFDRSKYQGNLTRKVEGLPEDFCVRADIGVPHKGTFKGSVVLPVYDKDTGEFMEYVAVENVRRFRRDRE